MLRFRRDRLMIGIEPDRLSLVRLKMPFVGISIPRIIDSKSIDLDENAGNSGLLDALKSELSDSRWQNTEAHIVLSDRLVRYFIAERPDGARNADEVLMAARLRFEDVFAEDSDTWCICLDMPPFASLQFGCALQKSFVTGLIGTCTNFRIGLLSLAPFAAVEYNRWRTALDGKEGWFAVFGSRSVWIGRQSCDGWASTNQYALPENITDAFSRLLAREFLRATANSISTMSADSSVVWMAGDLTRAALRQQLLSPTRRMFGMTVWPGQGAEWSAKHRIALSPIWPACA